MAREQTVESLEEEISHLPEGEGPQKELRDAYREMRQKMPSEERSAVFHDALMSVFKKHPQFRFSYDGKYFRHT